MKREISIIIATLLFLNFACSKIKQRNSEENLESKIKSCRISTYRVKIESGKLVKGEFFKCDSEYYDISNKLIKLRSNINDKVAEACFTYKYNKEGLDSLVIGILGLSSENFKSTYEYDKKNNCTKMVRYNNVGEIFSKTITYNDKKKNVEEVFDYYNNDLLSSKTIKTYDKNHNGINEKTYSANDKLTKTVTNKYSGDKLTVFNEIFSGSLIKRDTAIFEYDRKLIISKKQFGKENSEYNTKEDYKYTYDKKGNWVTCVEYTNNEPYFIKQRDITYYE